MLLQTEKHLNHETKVESVTGKYVPAVDVFVFMIKALKDHCLEVVAKQQTHKPAEHMIRWVLTVPAIWNDSAKDFMREAAFKAGLTKSKDSNQLLFALEPEAAGLFCKETQVKVFGGETEDMLKLKEGEKYLIIDAAGLFCKESKVRAFGGDTEKRLKLMKGEKYLVIDAGGGTVDITGYQVLNDGKVKELIIANGGAWGGITVDKKYKELLTELLGQEFIEECERQFPLELMKKFELQKKSLKGKDTTDRININL
jgi:molecular chaperone DnaK (HSP70)